MAPDFLKSLLWSYDQGRLNLKSQKRVIIVNVINYGDLDHWQWLARTYGKTGCRRVLEQVPHTELRPGARKLASIIFGVKKFNYAPRGSA